MKDDFDSPALSERLIAETDGDYLHIQGLVIKEINTKKAAYTKRFGTPRFVKLPTRIYSTLKCWNVIYTEVCQTPSPEMFMGLIVCPTPSIETISEIEVF